MAETVSPADLYARLREAATRVLVGQAEVFELLCVALCSNGHVILEGVPGTAKTLMAKLLARLVEVDFRRIQFTPDLMPSDILGTSVFDLATGQFHLKRGPIFTQVLLADEINRAPAKTQSALLESMEEHQVTLDGERHDLGPPFFVVATQNPIEYEGTYPLPEAQLDRFLFKVKVDYPEHSEEQRIVQAADAGFDARALGIVKPVVSAGELMQVIQSIATVTVDASIIDYIVTIVEATRHSPDISLGGSPRASIGLLQAAKARAAFHDRDYVTPDDIKFLAPPVLRHRLLLTPEAEIEGVTADRAIERTLGRVTVPR